MNIKSIHYLLSVHLLFLSTVAYADIGTIEVFIQNITYIQEVDKDLAHEEGFTLIYYDLGAQERIEKQISTNAQKTFQDSIDTVSDSMNENEFLQLNEGVRNQLILDNYEKHKGEIAKLKDTLFTPSMRDKYQRALDDQQYASEHGIHKEDLPALLFNNHVYQHTLDINKVIDGIDHAR